MCDFIRDVSIFMRHKRSVRHVKDLLVGPLSYPVCPVAIQLLINTSGSLFDIFLWKYLLSV